MELVARLKRNVSGTEAEALEAIRTTKGAQPTATADVAAGNANPLRAKAHYNGGGRGDLAAEGEDIEAQVLLHKHAQSATQNIVTIVKEFNPEVSQEKLSDYVHGVVHSDDVLGHVSAEFRETLRAIVPKDRAEWISPDIEAHVAAKTRDPSRAQKVLALATTHASAFKSQSALLLKHPRFQTVALGSGGGAVILGPTGGFIGFVGGLVVGTASGLVLAPFTFGLSIPCGVVVGGGVGACAGAAIGGGSGLVAGGSAGHVAHIYRAEIKGGLLHIHAKAGDSIVYCQVTASQMVADTKTKALALTNQGFARASTARGQTSSKAIELGLGAHKVLTHPKFHVTAASAAGGAVAVGAGGAAAGCATGGAIGAAVGLVPALFTFGLSIPIGAAIGGGAGLCLGAAAGGTAGAVGGGATGYNAHTYRNEIKSSAQGAWAKAGSCAGFLVDAAGLTKAKAKIW